MRNCLVNKSSGKLSKTYQILVAIIFVFVPVVEQMAQPQKSMMIDGETSYLQDFEQIDLLNQRISFNFSIVSPTGRQGQTTQIKLPLKSSRTMHYSLDSGGGLMYSTETLNGTESPPLSQFPNHTLYSQGGVRIEYDQRSEAFGQQYRHMYLVFRDANGTDYKLMDVGTQGRPNYFFGEFRRFPDQNRGRIFKSMDGSEVSFISNQDIIEKHDRIYPQDWAISGMLRLSDGTSMSIINGRIEWKNDRNGNRTVFQALPGNASGYDILDSLGHKTTIEYSNGGAGEFDKITFRGFQGGVREVKVRFGWLRDSLIAGASLESDASRFYLMCEFHNITCDSTIFDRVVIQSIDLPNGQQYKFKYSGPADLARVELPNGGAIEYESFTEVDQVGTAWFGANVERPNIDQGQVVTFEDFAFAKVVSRVVLPDGITPRQKTTFVPFTTTTSSQEYCARGIQATRFSDGVISGSSKHYFFELSRQPSTGYCLSDGSLLGFSAGWGRGKEYKTETYAEDGTLLRTLERVWRQKSTLPWYASGYGFLLEPENNPRIESERITLNDTGQSSLTTFLYDDYNNPTDTMVYDFSGDLLQRIHTDYLSDPVYTDRVGAHLLRLPLQTWVSGDINGTTKASLTQFEYDNYSNDAGHSALVTRSNVVGHDTTNFGTGNIRRGNVTAVTTYADAQAQTGAITAYSQYDILGNVVKTIDAKGLATTINYDDNFGSADGEARTNTPPSQLNGLNTFAFPKSSTNALGWVTGYSQVDYFTGASVNTEDINGVISKTIYNDPLDRPTQSVTAIGTAHERQSIIVYDDANRRIETKGDLFALGDNLIKSESFYDGLGRTFESRSYKDSGYVVSKSEFDALGRVKRVTNPYRPHLSEQELWTESFYDALGRVIKVKTPDNAEALTSYSGNAVTVTDQAGKLRRSITNALGQLIRVDEPDASGNLGTVASPNQATYYAYDTLNNLTTVNQGIQTRSFAYNSLSRLLSATNPESGIINYLYDNNGNLTRKTDARGVQTDYVYDALSRVTNRNYSTPGGTPSNYQATPNVTYTYDDSQVPFSKGKLTKVSNSISETRYNSFDILGRVLSSQQITDGQTHNSAYTYNLIGALIEQTYPSGRVVKNVLDNEGDLAQVQSKKNASDIFRPYASNFVYTAAGAVSSMKLGNGKFENTAFNSRLQPTQIGLGSSATDQGLLKLNYNYGTTNNNGNVLSQTITVPTVGAIHGFVATQNYSYDSLNRLKQATENITPNGGSQSLSWQQTYTFDRYGNRNFDEATTTTLPKDCTESGNPVVCEAIRPIVNPSANAGDNRLNGYTFDPAGNTTVDAEGRQFTYDAENKQVKVKDSQNQTIGEYSYDGDAKRVKKYVPATGETTIFVYDLEGKMVAEYSTQLEQAPKISYLTHDHLGSPRILTDQFGAVISRRDFRPYGEEIVRTGYGHDSIREKFATYERDGESGLDYAQARFYSSSLGRFNSADEPFLDQFEDNPQSWNLYLYVRNNPLNMVDPFGTAGDCPPGSVAGCYERDGKYYIKDADGNEGQIDDPFPVKSETREKDRNPFRDFFRGFRKVAEPALPILEAITPGAGVGGAVIKGGIWTYRGGKWLFNAFKAGKKVQQALCCFVAGTPVLTKDGLKPIEDIEVGDEVLSFNEQTGQVEYKAVVQTFERHEKEILRISVDGEGESLGVTPDHPFYVRVHRARDGLSSDDEGEWRVAGLLEVGDEIRLASGSWAKVVKVGKQKKGAKTYNFEVADNHNYFVGNTNLLVHNTCDWLKVLAKGEQSIFKSALKKATSKSGSFQDNLISLTQAVMQKNPSNQVWQIGNLNGSPVFGAVRNGLGIVEQGGKTLVVQKTGAANNAFKILGEFKP